MLPLPLYMAADLAEDKWYPGFDGTLVKLNGGRKYT